MNQYEAFEVLQRQYKTRLQETVTLANEVQLAVWQNSHDRVTLENTHHHIFSMYVQDGYESYHKRPDGWFNGGAPGRFCLMPKESQSTWDIRGSLRFAHFYCTDQHLRQLAEQTWDRSPASIRLDERIFIADPALEALYRHFLLTGNWRDPASQMMLSSASTMVMLHMLRQYSQLQWQAPNSRGGLAPAVLRRVKARIDAGLGEALTLAELAAEADLSEFHFSRMFRQSEGVAPHQYVMKRRLAQAEQWLRHSSRSITDIALACGFSSASHFSQRFRAEYGITPSALRQQCSG
ncbi:MULTISPECIES: helix-turn-helix domain-containing protein [Dickeya]|uniref:helix-turn-helix domain-containing protein n=1 Tax=Dickeya TaxID=204037 RepID=UPI000676620E|nr:MULTISPECIES: helix-turn-helix domain-containing protein [Dickeya]UMB78534.1 AraC family transcriptional regulator [Dickeya fangzhongdai]